MTGRGPSRPVKRRRPSHGQGGIRHRTYYSSNNSSTPHFIGRSPGRPVKGHEPPHGFGRGAHIKTTSICDTGVANSYFRHGVASKGLFATPRCVGGRHPRLTPNYLEGVSGHEVRLPLTLSLCQNMPVLQEICGILGQPKNVKMVSRAHKQSYPASPTPRPPRPPSPPRPEKKNIYIIFVNICFCFVCLLGGSFLAVPQWMVYCTLLR